MPMYTVACAACGPGEVVRPISQYRDPLACPTCSGPATQTFLAQHAHHVRIDDMASVGRDRTDPRVRDVNIGLGGDFVDVGKYPNGERAYDFRPTTNADASSNRAAREIAKRQGLTPADSGRYRSGPR